MQVNVLSTALLALLLLPWLKSAGRGKAHLGIVGSGLHRGVDISAGNGWPQEDVVKYWNEKENWQKKGGQGMYGVSKLLVQYCMGEIAKLAKGEDGKYASPTTPKTLESHRLETDRKLSSTRCVQAW